MVNVPSSNPGGPTIFLKKGQEKTMSDAMLQLTFEGMMDERQMRRNRDIERMLTGTVRLMPGVRLSVLKLPQSEFPMEPHLIPYTPLIRMERGIVKLKGKCISNNHGYFLQKDGEVEYVSMSPYGIALEYVAPLVAKHGLSAHKDSLDRLCELEGRQLFAAREGAKTHTITVGAPIYFGHPMGPYYKVALNKV